ncbi:MAG: NAD(P)/FAD-dependent oxidoreductase [Myxococcales bacterium]|nr:NAD(P)/FAD-dependent oxidoreductase [Myxococcales bacterium]
METVDFAVIGAGVVGLACAARLASLGSVLVIEREAGPGRGTTSRNSGVIHAGLYYPPGSLKARLCVDGRRRLYRWCAERGVDHRKTGKVVLAVDPGEVPRLDALVERARHNGAGAIARWDTGRLRTEEPLLRASAALYSPESGIVDAHGLVESLVFELRRAPETDLVLHTAVDTLDRDDGGWIIGTVDTAGGRSVVRTRALVNAAGLAADAIAERSGLDVDARSWRHHLCKGDYFALGADAPRPRHELVYPLPSGGGLGVHLTADLGGRRTAGPDATYVDAPRYAVDASKAPRFAESVARYLPDIRPEHLTPDYAGLRPKLSADGSFRDFVIAGPDAHGQPRTVHLLGIESPGLTASLAIARHVERLLTAR